MLWLKRLNCLFLLIITIIFVLLSPAQAQNRFQGTVVAVESGDRIRVRLDSWVMTVRLHGITCPETPTALADRARAYTARRVQNTVVRVEVRGTGSRQTVYGEVYPLRGESLNAELVRTGLALWSQEYAPTRTDLSALETEARQEKRGMWGDPDGANVPLPSPARVRTAVSSRPAPTVSPASSVSPAIVPPTRPATTASVLALSSAAEHPFVVYASGKSTENAGRLAGTVDAREVSSTKPVKGIAVSVASLPIILIVFAVLVTMFLFAIGGFRISLLPAQVGVGLVFGSGITLLVPLPFYVTAHAPLWDTSALIVLIATPVMLFCMFVGYRLFRQEQALRAAAQRPIAEAEPGFVRIAGQTEPLTGLVHSQAGRIPGIYVREITERYILDLHRGGRGVPAWVEVANEEKKTDFLLRDASGTALVDASAGTFHPLRVARFYNGVPVERFFETAYVADTRTSVFFIPGTANLTIWGHAYRTASPFPGSSEQRIGPEPRTGLLLIVEETPNRIFTNRPVYALLLTLFATALGVVILIALFAPDRFTGSG